MCTCTKQQNKYNQENGENKKPSCSHNCSYNQNAIPKNDDEKKANEEE
jgi:hypothetical protein